MKNELQSFARLYWPEIVAVAAPVIVFAHIVFGGQVLYWGLPALQFVPWRVLVNEALRSGHLPLWTPLLGMGVPLFANYQSAALYPPNWLALILPPETAISILAVLHLSWAGLGMVRLARQIGLGNFSAAVAAVTFALSGYLTGRLWFITINNAIVWLPWIVAYGYFPVRSLNRESGAPPVLGQFLILTILLTFQLLAGHAQSMFYVLLIVGAWISWHSFLSSTENNLRSFIANVFVIGLALSLALGVCALQLLPTYELLNLSPRADAAEYDFAMTYSLWPWRLLTFVAPTLFGHPADGNYWGYASYWEDNAYLGLLPLIFAVYAIWGVARLLLKRKDVQSKENVFSAPQTSTIIFCLLLAIISIVLAFGANTPIFPIFYRFIPGFDLFQAPARMLIGYTFAFSLLAGLGAHYWHASERKRYWSRLGIAGGLAMLAFGALGGQVAQGRIITIANGVLYTAILAAVTFGLFLLQPVTSNLWRGLVILFVITDLGLAAVRLNPTTDRALYLMQPIFRPITGRLFQTNSDEYNAKFRFLFRFQDFGKLDVARLRTSLLANLPVLSSIATANNFDPLMTARYAQYIKLMESHPRLVDLADVTSIVSSTGIVTTRPEGAARLRIVYNAQTVDSGEAALAAISNPSFDPDTGVILEPTVSSSIPTLVLDPHHYSTTVTLDRAGYVVLSDMYYPGWQVRVDGELQPLFIADYAFRAVAVPSGTHTVTFEYAPVSVTIGLVISSLSLLFILALIVVTARAFRRPRLV